MEDETWLQHWREREQLFAPIKKDDVFALAAIQEAFAAADSGNFGIGAVLVDIATGAIVCRGQNKLFSHSRSDMHAEMDLINKFEDLHGARSSVLLKEMALYTSLESCPMCMCRLITAGVTKVYHVANDETGGMVHLREQLPEIWRRLAKNSSFETADCSVELRAIAEQVFLATKKRRRSMRLLADADPLTSASETIG